MSVYMMQQKAYFTMIDADLNKNMINHPPYMIPWIMQCNPLRYPSFLENFPPDNRLN